MELNRSIIDTNIKLLMKSLQKEFDNLSKEQENKLNYNLLRKRLRIISDISNEITKLVKKAQSIS